ncbi:GGDEF domain-containing protein [Hippea alviniae]|uniref:GGDEF domain-containing protein n=1 Tax=Hippea alviniae TaxID=1279027 RepID=UPI00042691AD|nr:GGDEF domain-containing protein [Hippea alviniae]
MRKRAKSIVKDSARLMILMGIFIGAAFIPFSEFVLKLPQEKVYSTKFLLSTISAGISVGLISFFVVNLTILRRLKEFENNIETITDNIFQYQTGKVKSIQECQNCYLKILSSDIIGRIATKYNSLIRVIRGQFWQHETLEEFSTKISTINLTNKLNKTILDFLISKLEILGGEIYLLTSGDINLIHSSRTITNLTSAKKKSLIDIIENGKTVHLRNEEVEIVDFGTGKIRPKEVSYFPIKHGNKAWLFAIYSNYLLSRERKSLIEKMLNEYKFAYESAEMYEKLQNMAAYDELTGIYNRRFGMRRINEEYKRALRSKSALFFLMFDIDHFKKINDTYGHQAGDYILASFGRILSENLRAEDIAMRYGGEEFLCVIGNSGIEDAVKKADTIRKIVEESTFKWNDINIKITVSGGVSALNPSQDTKTPEDAIKEADEALYQAKRNGRNRIVKHASL